MRKRAQRSTRIRLVCSSVALGKRAWTRARIELDCVSIGDGFSGPSIFPFVSRPVETIDTPQRDTKFRRPL